MALYVRGLRIGKYHYHKVNITFTNQVIKLNSCNEYFTCNRSLRVRYSH